LDKAIETYMQLLPAILNSISGIGPVCSAGLLAEIADVHRFKNQAALVKFVGITWERYQSGDYEASDTRLILSGNKYLKYYFLEGANKVRVHDANSNAIIYPSLRKYQSISTNVPSH